MTKRDYILLAKICARHKHQISKWFLVDLCNALYIQNQRFDTERFMSAVENTDVKD